MKVKNMFFKNEMEVQETRRVNKLRKASSMLFRPRCGLKFAQKNSILNCNASFITKPTVNGRNFTRQFVLY